MLEFESEIAATIDTVDGRTIVFFQNYPETYKSVIPKRKGVMFRNLPWDIIFSNEIIKAENEGYRPGDRVKITIKKLGKGFPRNIID